MRGGCAFDRGEAPHTQRLTERPANCLVIIHNENLVFDGFQGIYLYSGARTTLDDAPPHYMRTGRVLKAERRPEKFCLSNAENNLKFSNQLRKHPQSWLTFTISRSKFAFLVNPMPLLRPILGVFIVTLVLLATMNANCNGRCSLPECPENEK